MKAVILAGGLGTRLSEETEVKPKPMIEIGGFPLLWHIMHIYSRHGINEFIICLGYKGYCIKEYFLNYHYHSSDLEIDLKTGRISTLDCNVASWKVSLIDTGLDTMTGGRLKRVKNLLGNDTFCLTYGDGLANVNVHEEIAFHKAHGKHVTVTAVQPPGRFGILDIAEVGNVKQMREKPAGEGGWINGGFFVMEPEVFDYIEGDGTTLEKEPLDALASAGQLMAHRHFGFWHPCDTLRDLRHLRDLWFLGKAEWTL